jgi:tRNA (cmo5U34)-methyltransferase
MIEPAKRDTNIHEDMGPRWQFTQSVADVFDEMLERSIPQYDVMRSLVTDIAIEFRQQGTDILDIGTSRGEAIKPLVDLYGSSNTYVGVESAPAMAEVFRDRYAHLIDSGIVRFFELDLREELPPCRASVVMSVLTLMFVPINYRQRIIADIFQTLVPGGAFVLVEKVLGEGRLNDIMIDKYHSLKQQNGYSREEIDRKALALEGVQVPLTASWNEQMLRSAGFTAVDCFWRCWNFAGWVAVKG